MPKNAQTTTQRHSSHKLVKQCLKFSKPGFNSTWTGNFDVQAGFRKGRGTRESNCQCPLGCRKSKSSRKTSTSALLSTPKPLTVWITTNCGKFFKRWEYPDHLTCLLRNFSVGQEATVGTGHGTTDWFQRRKEVRQSCILSPCLFNLYAEYIMWNARLEEA